MQPDKRSFLEKYFKHFAISLWLLLVLYFLLFEITPLGEKISMSSWCSEKKEISSQSWNGIVTKKKISENNHNAKSIYITHLESDLPLININTNLYFIADLGDSIVKKNGSLKVIIYKKDSIINYEYLTNCKE